jgi:hypothetical protein
MSHPFTKIFEKALRKSSLEENFVLEEAKKLCKKGYSFAEVSSVLQKLAQALIDARESEIVHDAEETLAEELD